MYRVVTITEISTGRPYIVVLVMSVTVTEAFFTHRDDRSMAKSPPYQAG